MTMMDIAHYEAMGDSATVDGDALLRISFGKIVASKRERGGARLHKSLMVLKVMRRAKQELFARSAMQPTPFQTTEQPKQPMTPSNAQQSMASIPQQPMPPSNGQQSMTSSNAQQPMTSSSNPQFPPVLLCEPTVTVGVNEQLDQDHHRPATPSVHVQAQETRPTPPSSCHPHHSAGGQPPPAPQDTTPGVVGDPPNPPSSRKRKHSTSSSLNFEPVSEFNKRVARSVYCRQESEPSGTDNPSAHTYGWPPGEAPETPGRPSSAPPILAAMVTLSPKGGQLSPQATGPQEGPVAFYNMQTLVNLINAQLIQLLRQQQNQALLLQREKEGAPGQGNQTFDGYAGRHGLLPGYQGHQSIPLLTQLQNTAPLSALH